MPNEYYDHGAYPASGAAGRSADARAEFDAIELGFDRMPPLQGNAYKIAYVNAGSNRWDTVGGNGILKLSTSAVPSIAVKDVDFLAPSGGNMSGSLNFVGDSLRFTGDFTSTPIAKRLCFQTNVVNGGTGLTVIPNGTSKIASIACHSSSDPDNSGYAVWGFDVNGLNVVLASSANGTGTTLPLVFSVGGERLRITTNGIFQAPSYQFQALGTNAGTNFSILPNGTSKYSGFFVYSDSATANAAYLELSANNSGGGASIMAINAARAGTGPFLPLVFMTGNSERARFTATGQFQANFDTLVFQHINPNSPTTFNVTPNGTGTYSAIAAWNNSNLGTAQNIHMYSGGGDIVGIVANKVGAVNYPHLAIVTGGNERMRIIPTGQVGIGCQPSGAGFLELGGTNADGLNLIMTHGAVDANFQLWARNGKGVGASGNMEARLALAYYGVAINGSIDFMRGGGPADGWLELSTQEVPKLRINSNTNGGGLLTYGGLELGGLLGGDHDSYIDFHASAGSDYDVRMYRGTGANGSFSIENKGTGEISIWSNGQIAMRILPGSLQVNFRGADIGNTGQTGILCCTGRKGHDGISGANWSNPHNFHWTGSVQVWIDDVNCGNISLVSDPRIKQDIRPFQSALEKVLQWEVISYRWRDIDIWKDDGQDKVGFNARTMWDVSPETVSGEPEALTRVGGIQPLTVDLLPTVAMLTRALQELTAKVAYLEDLTKILEVRQ